VSRKSLELSIEVFKKSIQINGYHFPLENEINDEYKRFSVEKDHHKVSGKSGTANTLSNSSILNAEK
jgi:hypothetical protein